MSKHHGTVHWNELITSDVKKSVAYYTDLMGWTVDEMPMGDGNIYYLFKKGDDIICGAAPNGPEMGGAPDSWMTYLAVSDVDAAAAASTAAGGTILAPAFDVPGVGRIVMLADPTGAVLGLMTPADG